MAPQRWTPKEIALVVFYASRRVCHQACSDLLLSKLQATRDYTAVRSKLRSLRMKTPGLHDGTKTWCLSAVEAWLEQFHEVEDLLTFNEDDLSILCKVRILKFMSEVHFRVKQCLSTRTSNLLTFRTIL